MMQSVDLLASLNAALMHSLWQITLISAAAWFLLRHIPEKHNSVRYAVSTFCLFLIPIVFCITFLGVKIEPAIPQYANEIAENQRENYFIPVLWTLTTLFGIFELYFNWMGVRHLSQAAFEKPDAKLTDTLASISRKMGITKTVELRLSDICTSPGTIGFWKPIIFLPLSCFTHLSDLEIEAVLGHELAHIRRHDYLWTWLRSLIKVLFYFHPGTHFLIRNISKETEYACDELALKGGGNSTALATGLLKLRLQPNNALILNISPTSSSELEKRIERLTGAKSAAHKTKRSTSTLLITMIIVTAFVWMFALYQKQVAHAASGGFLSPSHLTRVELVALKDEVCDRLWDDNVYSVIPHGDGEIVQITVSDSKVLLNDIPLPDRTQTKLKTIFQTYGLAQQDPVELRYYHDYITLES